MPKIPTRPRGFELVVKDIKKCCFLVCRLPQTRTEGEVEVNVLGSGFFVSPTMFLTCQHVLDPMETPHRDGDDYLLVANERGQQIALPKIASVERNHNLFLKPDCDAALLDCSGISPNDFVDLSFGDVNEGQEVGAYGYPLPQSMEDEALDLSNLMPRVHRGIVTSQAVADVQAGGLNLVQVPVIEVDCPFMPGNSGGPVFDAKTGLVIAYVNGFNDFKIEERLETCDIDTPDGLGPQYIRPISVVYSYGIAVSSIREWLEELL